jgi:hypothetical protein
MLLAGYAIGIAAWVALLGGVVVILRWSWSMLARGSARWQRGRAPAVPVVPPAPVVPQTGFLDWQAIDAAAQATDWRVAA